MKVKMKNSISVDSTLKTFQLCKSEPLCLFLSVNTESETAVVNVTYASREQARQ